MATMHKLMRCRILIASIIAFGFCALGSAQNADDCMSESNAQRIVEGCTLVLQRDPASIQAYGRRAQALVTLNQFDSAMADALKVITNDPKSATAYVILSRAYNGLGRSLDAVGAASRAVELEPGNLNARYIRGLSYVDLDRYGEAVEDFNFVLSIVLDNASIFNVRAWSLLKLGRLDLALRDAEAAVRMADKDPIIRDTRGHIYEALGRSVEAAKDYAMAVSLRPDIRSSREGLHRIDDVNRVLPNPPLIGVRFDGPQLSTSMRVSGTIVGSAAAMAGIKQGDILLSVDAVELRSVEQLQELVKSRSAGDRLRVRLQRQSETVELFVVLSPIAPLLVIE